MDRYGIHEALIVDSLSFDYHPEVGNTRDVYQVAEQERLHPPELCFHRAAGKHPRHMICWLRAAGAMA